jgi:hypothetical protein
MTPEEKAQLMYDARKRDWVTYVISKSMGVGDINQIIKEAEETFDNENNHLKK